MNKTRNFLIGALILALLASTSIIALSARSDDLSVALPQELNLKGGRFSGNDVYDPAVYPSLAVDDSYDAAFDLAEIKVSGNYSGDDIYDAAAIRIRRAPSALSSRNFSGDDVYDAAAIRSFDISSLQDNGNYSGDDGFDLAAGR